MSIHKKSAFTLIELLVVIAIIGMLATLSVVALNSARVKARDAKRLADIKQVRLGLELYYDRVGKYPANAELSAMAIIATSTGLSGTYMAKIPSAPSNQDGPCSANQNNYIYNCPTGNNTYTISYCLGQANSIMTAGPKCATPGSAGQELDCSGSGGIVLGVAPIVCVDTTWTPDPATQCANAGQFTQTSNCGNTRQTLGTRTGAVCSVMPL